MVNIQAIRIGPTPRIAVDFAGAGELVILMHGIGGNKDNWTDQLRALSERYLAVAWDTRGWGDSDDYEGPLTMADIAADLVRVIEHFGASRADLVGLSMGGMIAQDFWFRHPERVRSLVLCDTSPGLRGDRSDVEIEEFLALRRKPLLEGKTPADIAPNVARTLSGRAATELSTSRLVSSLSKLHTGSYLKALETITRHALPADVSTIHAPCLLIVGEDDRLTPPSIHERMHAAIAGSQLTVLPKAGHLSNVEAPETFNAALLAFLAERPAA